jgi:hypothetical protein
MHVWRTGFAGLAMVAALAGCATGGTVTHAPVSFAAMGDGPRGNDQWPLMAEQIFAENADPRSSFIVHLGDITSGTATLPESWYVGVAGMLKTSEMPVYIVIGDNEWNDLQNPAIGWALWRKHLENIHRHFPNAAETVNQPEQPDNFAFTQDGVLFIGINVVGGTVHDPAEWTRRHGHNLKWVDECFLRFGDDVRAAVVLGQARPSPERHGDFFERFAARVAAFEKPVLYLHGDGHTYLVDAPWKVPNLVRSQVDSVGKNPPLLVTVHTDTVVPFTFDRRLPATPTPTP